MTPVTDHAVLRWLQRVRRVDFTLCPGGWTETERASWGCRKLGMTLDEARDVILPPKLQKHLALDPWTVRAPDRVLVVVDRAVVTCLEAGSRPARSTGGYRQSAECP